MNYKETKTLRFIVRIGNYSADKSRRLNSRIICFTSTDVYCIYI